jgi:hypothetical protein
MTGFRVEMRAFRHRVFGANTIPHAVWVDNIENALQLIGKQREAARFMALVDQIRSQFAHVESFLMSRETLLAFKPYWGVEARPTLRNLTRLGPEEQALYDDLRDNRLGKNIRLEQEHIGFGWVESALATLVDDLKEIGQ